MSFFRRLFFPAHPKTIVHISEFVEAVQDAINPFYQSSPSSPSSVSWLPRISSVKLALQTFRELKITGGLQYLVIAAEGYYDDTATEEVTLTLVPQAPGISQRATTTQRLITQALHDAIAAVQKEVKPVYGSGANALRTNEIDVQVSFVLAWSGSAGVDKWTISPIQITAKGEYTSKMTHTVTVVFK